MDKKIAGRLADLGVCPGDGDQPRRNTVGFGIPDEFPLDVSDDEAFFIPVKAPEKREPGRPTGSCGSPRSTTWL